MQGQREILRVVYAHVSWAFSPKARWNTRTYILLGLLGHLSNTFTINIKLG